MSFNRVDQARVADDAINAGRDALVLPWTVEGQVTHWANRVMRRDQPEAVAGMIGALVLGLSKNVAASQDLLNLHGTVLDQHTSVRNARKAIAAMYSLSVFMQHIVPDKGYVASGGNGTGVEHMQVLIDINERDMPPAYSAIIPIRQANRHGDFVPEIEAGTNNQWYYNDLLGLYVNTQVPAQLSPTMRHAMRESLGSDEAVERMLQPDHSVQLSPYASLSWLMR